jgi:hypothetical protein
MQDHRVVWAAYIILFFVVVGFNIPIPPAPEEQCADYIHHLISQFRPGPSGKVMGPNLVVSYDLCVQRMEHRQ